MRLDLPKRAVIEAYESGLSIKKVAAQFGCSVAAVHKLLKTHNVPRRPQGAARKLVDVAAIVAAYQAGRSAKYIAREHGIGIDLVLLTLRRADVTPRRGATPGVAKPRQPMPTRRAA